LPALTALVTSFTWIAASQGWKILATALHIIITNIKIIPYYLKEAIGTPHALCYMPGIPAFSLAGAAHAYSPADTFVLRPNGQISILDTVFVSKRSRRAVYATTTRGPHTSLWRVAASGTMTEMARIDWEYEVRVASAGDGSLRNSTQPTKRCSVLTFRGRMVRTEEFLRKGRGWFSSE
jgi:hypothetical protein